MNEEEFILNAALYAMQGIQEMGGKLGIIAELLPNEVAKRSFDLAFAMLAEARERDLF